MTNGVWGELTFEPVDASLRDLILKYAVDSDCGRVESRNMKVSVIPTALDDVEVPDEETVTKILINNQVLIIRGGKIYTMMGVEIDIDTNMWFPDWQDQFSEDRFGDNSSRSSFFHS